MFRWLTKRLGTALAHYLNEPIRQYHRFAVTDPTRLLRVIRPGDVLLVEGDKRVSVAIKYLTQSTWSHAAIFVGDALQPGVCTIDSPTLIEADMVHGVMGVPLEKYRQLNTRICRPVNLLPEDSRKVVEFMVQQIGRAYDLRNVVDLARYLLPMPPVPSRYRRRMLAIGSGDPTRAICSTVLAEAFEHVRYPILPKRELRRIIYRDGHEVSEEAILRAKHSSLYTPRDFDLSPYFAVVKPTIEIGFDYRTIRYELGTRAEG